MVLLRRRRYLKCSTARHQHEFLRFVCCSGIKFACKTDLAWELHLPFSSGSDVHFENPSSHAIHVNLAAISVENVAPLGGVELKSQEGSGRVFFNAILECLTS